MGTVEFFEKSSKVDFVGGVERFFHVNSAMTISKLNQNGSAAVRIARDQGQLAITEHGETVAFILSAEKVEGILDTLEILGDGEAMKTIRV